MIESTKNKILVVQIGKIGDMILTTPLFSNLKKIFPESELNVLTSLTNHNIISTNPYVNKRYIYNKKFFSSSNLILKLRQNNFDYWIDTKTDFSKTSNWLLKFSKPKNSIGYHNNFDIIPKSFVFGKHVLDYNIAPYYFFDNKMEKSKILPEIYIPSEIKGKFNNIFHSDKRKKIIINYSAGEEKRHWNDENWLELINKLNDKYILLLIGLEKVYNNINNIIVKSDSESIFYVKTESLFEVSELVKNADLVISPDTSLIHIASAFNTPVIGLYNNVEWNYKKFAPVSDKNRVIISDKNDSINSIKSVEVVNAIKELL